MDVSEHHASLKPLYALLWNCCFKTNKQVGERERERGRGRLGKREGGQWCSICGNVCAGRTKSCYSGNLSLEGERPVKDQWDRIHLVDEIWVTQKSQSQSPMGHFWGLKEEGMRKWKRRTQKGEQHYLGTSSPTHTCAERGLLNTHLCTCVFVSHGGDACESGR